MSFVIATLFNNKLYIASDGQVTNESGVLVNNYCKIKKAGVNNLIGFTGSKDICEKVLENIDKIQSQIIDTTQLTYTLFLNLAKVYSDNPNLKKELYKCNMVIGGYQNNLLSSNKYIIYTISSDKMAISQVNIPKCPKIPIVKLYSENITASDVNDIISKHLSHGIYNIDYQLSLIIKDISKIDESVNRVAYILSI